MFALAFQVYLGGDVFAEVVERQVVLLEFAVVQT